MPRAEPLNVPPEEAIEHFRSKGYHTGFDWRDTSAAQHVKSFTVAKAMEIDILEDIRSEVDDAIANGRTFGDFRDALEPTLARKGWWGKREMVDPETGESRIVQLGSPRRLRTIFDTNIRTAYAEGQWRRIERVAEARPYLRYSAVLDARTRPQHRAWHGLVLPWDHPFWETHFPPNGWRCRCSVSQWSAEDLEEHGWQVSPDPDIEVRPWRNRRTGRVHQVPAGIDPGWDHNVGKTSGRVRLREVLLEKAEGWPDAALESRAGDFGSRAFADFIRHARANQKTYWPVAAVTADRARKMGLDDGQARIVDLSPDTVEGHRERFQGFSPEDWARVQVILKDGIWIERPDNRWMVLMRDDGRPWRIVVKRAAGGEVFLTTYHRLNSQKQMERLIEEGGPGGS